MHTVHTKRQTEKLFHSELVTQDVITTMKTEAHSSASTNGIHSITITSTQTQGQGQVWHHSDMTWCIVHSLETFGKHNDLYLVVTFLLTGGPAKALLEAVLSQPYYNNGPVLWPTVHPSAPRSHCIIHLVLNVCPTEPFFLPGVDTLKLEKASYPKNPFSFPAVFWTCLYCDCLGQVSSEERIFGYCPSPLSPHVWCSELPLRVCPSSFSGKLCESDTQNKRA